MRSERRHKNLRRVLTLWTQLQGLRYAPRLVDLARDLGCCPRTVRRDLDLLEEVGFVVPHWKYNDRAA